MSEARLLISIRPATAADVPLVLALIREFADFEKLPVVATEEGLRRALFGPRPAAEAVVAELGGGPAGFALFYPTYSTFQDQAGVWLEDLYVRPEARGRGLGRALLAHVARLARERGCGRVEWSVLDWNEKAVRFYRGLGARPFAEGCTFYRLAGEALGRLADGA